MDLRYIELWPYVMPMIITGLALFAMMRLADHTVDPVHSASERRQVWPLGG
jgi:hypothetical protein